MRYCTVDQLLLSMSERTLIELSNDDVYQTTGVNAPVVAQVIDDAEQLVDGYLSGRYDMPLPIVPTILRQITRAIACHMLYARRPDGRELPQAVSDLYRTQIRLLEHIRDGRISLGIPKGPTYPSSGEFKVISRPKLFDRSTLEDY